MNGPAPLRVVIADDEPIARAFLRRLLAEVADVRVARECATGPEVVPAVREERPDLLFLDVHMPGGSGLEALAELAPEERPAVVLTTAFDRYAVRAFEEQVVDYLLKPFDRERFRLALERAQEHLALRSLARPELADEPGYARWLGIARQGGVERVEVDRLVWIEAADQYVHLHTADGSHLMRESMNELERRLDPERFLRVHRSALVALEHVTRLETRPGHAGRLLLDGGAWVPVSRVRVPAVRRRLAAWGRTPPRRD
ncbi:MAG: response regulator transcription factor [Planctomycetes bacterium]|nr:response regulator transcription factor [Planctomycetota bacterium]